MSTFEDKLRAIILADTIKEKKSRQKKISISLAVSFASICLILIFSLPPEPKDTFDDPVKAYEEIEKSFAYIAEQIEKSFDIIQKEEEKPVEKIKNILK